MHHLRPRIQPVGFRRRLGYEGGVDERKTTAEMAALARAAGALELASRNPDRLARTLLPPKLRLLLVPGVRHAMRLAYQWAIPGLYMFIQVRTHYIDRVLQSALDRGLDQLLILGAGLDSRAYRFVEPLRTVRVFELDFPATARWKRDLLARAAVPTDGIRFVEIDLTRERLAERLSREGFDPRARTLVIWEGVTMYLPQSAVAETLAFVGSCGAGSAIVFDYFYRQAIDRPERFHGARQTFAFMQRRGEPCLFGVDAADLAAFVAPCHLAVRSNDGHDALSRLVTLGRSRTLIDFGAMAVAEVPA